MRKLYEFNDFVKIQRLHLAARCSRDTLVMRPGHESLATKYNAGRMRAPLRAHDQSDGFLDLLRARTSSSTSSASSRSPASWTDGHQHRQRRCHHRRRYLRTVVIPIIAAAVAISIIVAAVADVILLSPTSEYRHQANLHRRPIDIITGVVDAIIGAVIGRAAAIRIMSFAEQVAGG